MEITFGTIMMIFIMFIIILLFAVGIGWTIRNRTTVYIPPNKYTSVLAWSGPYISDDQEKNTCQLYTFPTESIDINGINTIVPPTPTFNPNILDDISGQEDLPVCIDVDQIIAQKISHTCTAPQGVFEDQHSLCYLAAGGTTGVNGVEDFYSNELCRKVPVCPGLLSVVSVNFQVPTISTTKCIQAPDNIMSDMFVDNCNPANSDQLFRVTRKNFGQSPNSLTAESPQTGLLAQILHRETGLCVSLGGKRISSPFTPVYLADIGCTGTIIQDFPGRNVILTECGQTVEGITGHNSLSGGYTGYYPGYDWAFIPSVAYCEEPDGCHGCVQCDNCICYRESFSNRCIGTTIDGQPASCTGYQFMTTPPQIVYIGDLDLNQAPRPLGNRTESYMGLTGNNALIKWLKDQGALALYFGGNTSDFQNNILVARDIGTDNAVCSEKAFTSQYMGISTFNTVNTSAVCFADGIYNTDCTVF